MSLSDGNGMKLLKIGAIFGFVIVIGGEEIAKQLGMTVAFLAAMFVLDLFPNSPPTPSRAKGRHNKRAATGPNHNYPLNAAVIGVDKLCLLYTSPSPRD